MLTDEVDGRMRPAVRFYEYCCCRLFFKPVILRLCKQMKVAQSKILLPMACTALIGANLSLIGASHNLIVNSLLKESAGGGVFQL